MPIDKTEKKVNNTKKKTQQKHEKTNNRVSRTLPKLGTFSGSGTISHPLVAPIVLIMQVGTRC